MTRPVPSPLTPPSGARDRMPLLGIDHVELYVGNALQSAYFYSRALGFRRVAYRGLETGTRDRVSHVLQQGRIRLVLTGALDSRLLRISRHLSTTCVARRRQRG